MRLERLKMLKRKKRDYAYDCKAEYLHGPCEVCGEPDPYVLDKHHVIPKCTPGCSLETIILCANCHARVHRIWGVNNKMRPYKGPTTKNDLIRELHKELKKYKDQRVNPPNWASMIGARNRKIPAELVEKILSDHKQSGLRAHELAPKYGVCRETARKIIMGEYHMESRRKLTSESVTEMRNLAKMGLDYKELALRYGIHPAHALKIINYKIWMPPSSNLAIFRNEQINSLASS